MKKKYIIAFIGLFLFGKLEAKKINGNIIYPNNTMSVIFDIPFILFKDEPDYLSLQYEITYLDSVGNKRTLKPKEAKAIQFSYNNQLIRMVSQDKAQDISRRSVIFIKEEISGEYLSLFKFYYDDSYFIGDMLTSSRNERYILQKRGDSIKILRFLHFKKDMVEYFSDCPILVKKIESSQLEKKDLEKIVNVYNSNCSIN